MGWNTALRRDRRPAWPIHLVILLRLPRLFHMATHPARPRQSPIRRGQCGSARVPLQTTLLFTPTTIAVPIRPLYRSSPALHPPGQRNMRLLRRSNPRLRLNLSGRSYSSLKRPIRAHIHFGLCGPSRQEKLLIRASRISKSLTRTKSRNLTLRYPMRHSLTPWKVSKTLRSVTRPFLTVSTRGMGIPQEL